MALFRVHDVGLNQAGLLMQGDKLSMIEQILEYPELAGVAISLLAVALCASIPGSGSGTEFQSFQKGAR
jgi:hypothetical protein